MSKPVIVNVSENAEPGWGWLAGRFDDDPFQWMSFTGRPRSDLEERIQRPRISRYRACLEAARAAKKHGAQLIVTHTPWTAVWTSFACKAMGVKAPHLAFAFTFTGLPTGLRQRFFSRALEDVDRFVCFSSIERTRYAKHFNIPEHKIESLHWAVAEPEFDASLAPIEERPYLCAVGGEGRDYRTLVEAMRLLPDYRLAIVARPANVEGLDLPPNVSVRTNIPLTDAWNIIAHSKLMVLPITQADVPCGHVTLITAMNMGIPSIVTESAAMVDYVSNEANGRAALERRSARRSSRTERTNLCRGRVQ
jgi:glycosyltransferase involved in cell wall biosynthesis